MKKVFKRITALVMGVTVFTSSVLSGEGYSGFEGNSLSGTIVANAATSTTPEEIKTAIKQLCISMHKNHDYGYHYVRNWNIKYADYGKIWSDTEKNEVAFEANLNVNTVVQSIKDSDDYIEYIYEYSEDQFMKEREAAIREKLAYCHEKVKGMGQLDKLIWLNEYIVDNTYYYDDPDDVTRHHYSSVFGYGHGVCSAYEEAMEYLLEPEGFKFERVYSSNHVWLGITIDGKEYHYDPTWNDTRGARHRYLLRNDEEWGKSPCTHQTWFRYDGKGGKIYSTVSDSTDFTDWYVHDVSGRMFYHEGGWYYVKGKTIYKNTAYGKPGDEKEIYTSTNSMELIDIANDVLSYKEGGKLKTMILKETDANSKVATCSHTNTELRGAKEATCKFAGYTGDKYCSDCGIRMSIGSQIKVLAHQYGDAVTEKAATKKTGGYDFQTCSACGYRKKIYTPTLKAEDFPEGTCLHENVGYVGKVVPTCVKDGRTGDLKCLDCGALIFADAEVKCTGHIWKKQDGSSTVEKCMFCDATKGEETTTEKQTTSQKQTTTQQTTSQKQTTTQQTTSQKQTTAQQTTTKSTQQTTTQRETVQPQTTTKSTSQTTAAEKETTKSIGQTTTAEKETTKSAGQTTTAEKQTTVKGETTAQQTTTKSISQTTSQRETTSEKATTDKQTTTSEKATTDKQTTTSEKATTDKQTTTSEKATTDKQTTTSEKATTDKQTTTSEKVTTDRPTTTSGKSPEKETTKSEEVTTKPNSEEKVSKIKSFVVNKTNKNSVKLKWNKNTKVKGYEVSIYKNKKWTKLKNVSAKTTTLNVKKLKSGTYYRFRIRGYVINGNGTTYGAYTYCSTMTVPDKMSTPKVSKSGKKTVIKWKKENCSGYQIVYSKTKSFKKAGRVNVYGSKKTSYKTGKLNKKTTYYVKIRAFTKVKGKKVYGKYSGVRKVTKFST